VGIGRNRAARQASDVTRALDGYDALAPALAPALAIALAPALAIAVGPAAMLGALALLAIATTSVAMPSREPVTEVSQLRPTTTVPPTSSSVSTFTAKPADAKSSAVRSA
jgi:hypothetical protein